MSKDLFIPNIKKVKQISLEPLQISTRSIRNCRHLFINAAKQ